MPHAASSIIAKHLILRPWRLDDHAALKQILGDPVVMRFSDTGPLDAASRATWLRDHIFHQPSTMYPGCLAIECGFGGGVIGYISLKQDAERVPTDALELGIRLARSVWRQGYATQAAQTALHWTKTSTDLRRVVALVDPHNCASLGLVKKLKFTKVGKITFDGYDYPDLVYSKML